MGLFSKEALENLEREERSGQKRTVLIVDDEEHNLTTLKYALARTYNVLTASDGQDALDFLQNDPDPGRIHLIISDQRMPRMTGVEFLAQSIAIIPHAIRVVLTGFTDVEAIMDSINQARIYKFILKPLDEHDILLTIRRGLELYDLEEKNRRLVETLEFFNGQFFNHTRSIMQNVSGATELLARKTAGALKEDQNQLLAQIGASTDRLVHLFKRASDLSYVYTGDRPAETEQLDVIDLVREVGNGFSAGIDAADLTLEYEWDLEAGVAGGNAVFHVEADRELLCNALQEVLENGFAYAKKPTRITIKVRIEEKQLAIHIRDQGIGLENEGGMALVKPFARGARSNEFQPFGFGIGLANAKAFMEVQGGGLFFSQEQEGSTVVLRLPLPDYTQGSPFPEDSQPRKIAVFQENAEELQRVREALEQEGHQVLVFSTPEALLESVEDELPHLVLMDGTCSGKSTEPTIRKISLLGLGEPAPVVVLAGPSAESGKQAYLDSGAQSYVSKPVNYGQLTALVQQLL